MYADKMAKEISAIASKCEFYSNPELYLEPANDLSEKLVNISKKFYDFMKVYENETPKQKRKNNSLKELLINEFDNEQIWQELELQNNPYIKLVKNNTRILDSKIFSLLPPETSNETIPHSKERRREKTKETTTTSSESEDDKDFEENGTDMTDSDSEYLNEPKSKKYKSTVVDDPFFRLREMEEFLDEEDRREEIRKSKDADNDEDEENDDINFFDENLGASDDESVDIRNVKYKDFFDMPHSGNSEKKDTKEKHVSFEEVASEENQDVEDDDEDEDTDEDHDENSALQNKNDENSQSNNKSTFEEAQEEMSRKIERLEESNLGKKPWQLKGESSAKQRPVNSLLEEHVSFDHTSVGAPVITEETTESLEDLIKQRIKDQAWDDVERKQKPTTQPYEYKKAPELNMEKSKLSLAEVYEKEYLKQAEEDKEEKENEDHVLIKNLLDTLFVKLDALSNFHFTPKPPKPELKIITNTPSLEMEEVTPITMTTASQLAPEEIYDKKKGDVKGDGEKEVEDRKRERRQKKLKKKFAVKDKERKEKLKAKSGRVEKSSKKKAIDALKKGTRNVIVNEKNSVNKSVKSSNEFFSRLQDEAKKSISMKKLSDSAKQNVNKKKRTEFLKL